MTKILTPGRIEEYLLWAARNLGERPRLSEIFMEMADSHEALRRALARARVRKKKELATRDDDYHFWTPDGSACLMCRRHRTPAQIEEWKAMGSPDEKCAKRGKPGVFDGAEK